MDVIDHVWWLGYSLSDSEQSTLIVVGVGSTIATSRQWWHLLYCCNAIDVFSSVLIHPMDVIDHVWWLGNSLTDSVNVLMII